MERDLSGVTVAPAAAVFATCPPSVTSHDEVCHEPPQPYSWKLGIFGYLVTAATVGQ